MYFPACTSLLPGPGWKLLPQAQFQFTLSESATLYRGPEGGLGMVVTFHGSESVRQTLGGGGQRDFS